MDELVGKLSFDPLAFSNFKAKEQFDLLCDLCDIEFDFDKAESEKQIVYSERTIINRQLKELEAEEKNIDIDIFLPEESVDIQGLITELHELHEYNLDQEIYKKEIDEDEELVKENEMKIKELTNANVVMKKAINDTKNKQGQLKDDTEINAK